MVLTSGAGLCAAYVIQRIEAREGTSVA